MSALAGVRYFGGHRVADRTIPTLSASLVHRGADGVTSWSDDAAALLFARLHVSRGPVGPSLPLEDTRTGAVITGDIRLDNARELARELPRPLMAVALGAQPRLGGVS